MRLTQIKLAGFKTFVDPTVIPLPGQRVGVVGPNGCGKSNVIDAIRWVLGESSARQLRGESMQDVIFNGSGTRKPVSRASVELVFDNSLGKAAGQWSQYAEVSVKRVLHRDGESGYFINNLQVRKKDITDIFLGTGLGARAYAIIEQGMISRIIEARPEELRVFLEEAAGISKYKERRRETELRIRDTRDNLQRVEDIRQELAGQLLKLESQAEVARQYLELKKQLEQAQNLFRLFKKREAQALAERWQREVQRLANDLEAATAALRQAESQLEQVREGHYAASDALHAAQGDLYGANAEVARIEQSLQHQRDNRQRLASRIAAAREHESRIARQREEAEANLEHWRNELEMAEMRREEARERLEQESGDLPLAEQHFRDAQRLYADIQRDLNEARQSAQIEETHRSHAQRMVQSLQARRQRLEEERRGLPQFDEEGLAIHQEELAELVEQLENARHSQEELQERLPDAEQARREAHHAVQTAREHITKVEAQLTALRQMQTRLDQGKLHNWLNKHGLDGLPRLWQHLAVADGWDDALESVLRERLNAVLVEDFSKVGDWLAEPPPAPLAVALADHSPLGKRGAGGDFSDGEISAAAEIPPNPPFAKGGMASSNRQIANFKPLTNLVTWRDGALPVWLAASLANVYLAPDPQAALAQAAELPPGAWLVTRAGHLIGRDGVLFHAPQSELHGVLGRQRDIANLESELETRRHEVEEAKIRAERADAALAEIQRQLGDWRAAIGDLQQRHHKQQLEVQRLAQIGQQVAQRAAKIAEELAEVTEQQEIEQENIAEATANLEQAAMQSEALEEQLEDQREARNEAEAELNRQREALRGAERTAQEADFAERGCRGKIGELENFTRSLDEQLENVHGQLEELLEEQQSADDPSLQMELQEALATRGEREQALAAARNHLESLTAQLRDIESQRLSHEQKLNPLRDSVGEARLKEQEARLAQEQFSTMLNEVGADEEALAPLLDRSAKASGLLADTNRLDGEIAALGAVNLAALEELQVARERQSYLEAQAADLTEALETLEAAIRRIDRETRERLQATFDLVNKNISELFPTLFGGGRAELVMTGEEILDAGVQMIAQPPGKKNSSIHLLSGGEKALTALSLTFSLFMLNPAPFCLLDEVDAPLDDSNTERFCKLVEKMSQNTQFIYISHNKITMEMAEQLVGVTMQEQGCSRVVAVDIEEAIKLKDS